MVPPDDGDKKSDVHDVSSREVPVDLPGVEPARLPEEDRHYVPFELETADGQSHELNYRAPYRAEEHDERELLENLPWFESGKPTRNWMLQRTDFYDEVENVWGKKWGAEGIGKLQEVLVSRPTLNETREIYAEEHEYYYSSQAENADLEAMQAEFDRYYEILEDHGVTVHYLKPPLPAIGPYGYLKNLVTLAGAGLVVKGGAIVHRMGMGSFQRGREVIWQKALSALQVPVYHTIFGRGVGEPGAGRWLDSKTYVFNEGVVANEEGMDQIEWVLDRLGIEFVRCKTPGWHDTTARGNIGTIHADMFVMVPDIGLAVVAPQIVDYTFIKYLKERDIKVLEVPLDEYWKLATNGVNIEPGKVIINEGSEEVFERLDEEGIDVIPVSFEQSHKYAIAGLHCATLELRREQPGPLLPDRE